MKILDFINQHSLELNILLAFVIAAAAIIMCLSLVQNNKMIEVAAGALEMQRKEFKVRNRPLLDATRARFGGPLKSAEGELFPHTVEIELKNLTDIPAINFKAKCKISINDQVVKETKMDLSVLLQGTPWQGEVFLTKNIYEQAVVKSNKFLIHVSSTYSGVLGDDLDDYSIEFDLIYFPDSNDFRFANKRFK